MMRESTILSITAILAIAAIEITNLIVRGIDSTIMGIVIAAIAGAAGYSFGYFVSSNGKRRRR